MVCVSRSRFGFGGLIKFCINFLRYRTGHFRSEKKHPEMGQAPTSQARPRYTDHVRPSNLAARTLSLVEHMLSKFGGDTYVACEARTHGSNEVLCANSTFFLVQAVNRNDPSLPTALLAGFSTMKGKLVLCSVFGYDNCWSQQH